MLAVKKQSYRDTQRERQVIKEAETGVMPKKQRLLVLSLSARKEFQIQTSILRLSEQNKEKAMATHSSNLAWKIPRTEEPGRLQSMGSRRVGHD